MVIIQWMNKEGYTLKLTDEEKDELLELLKRVWGRPFRDISGEHFNIENDN